MALLLLALLAACTAGEPTVPPPGLAGGTGIQPAPEFLTFYNQYGGLRIFGNPLGDIYLDESTGRRVQYFQRMRLEIDPAGGPIIITPLGEWAVPPPVEQALASVAGDSPHSRSFPETGLAVQDAFLDFYEANNGPLLLGPPISPQLIEGGRRVQYFRNARLEWDPDAPLDNRIQVSLLGQSHYQAVGIYENPVIGQPVPAAIMQEAAVTATVKSPILYANEEQVIFVTVETPQGGQSVAGALVSLVVTYGGQTQVVELGQTGSDGKVQGPIVLPNIAPGLKVQVQVSAASPGSRTLGSTSLSFKTWW